MANDPLATIIVNNYNYVHFLREAIDSALEQTYTNVEVIVVDDGSTDRSQEVIAGYGNRVAPLFKQNGGQNSALNAGFSLSRGEVIIFLDSDDVLLPTTVEKAVQSFNDSNVANVHWPLWLIDENSLRSGQVWPPGSLTDGYFRDAIIREGPHAANVSSPTSGNAWSRSFLRDVAPIPEAEFWNHGDTYLNTLAPLFGTVKSIREPQGCYRVHGTNVYISKSTQERNQAHLRLYEESCAALSARLKTEGVDIDPDVWMKGNEAYSWMQRMRASLDQIAASVPLRETFILVDLGEWIDSWGRGEVIPGRRAVPFLEREGRYWGMPSDDSEGIREIERMREAGAGLMVFAWPAFWCLEHYSEMHRYLRAQFRCVLENDNLVVFNLQRGEASA